MAAPPSSVGAVQARVIPVGPLAAAVRSVGGPGAVFGPLPRCDQSLGASPFSARTYTSYMRSASTPVMVVFVPVPTCGQGVQPRLCATRYSTS